MSADTDKLDRSPGSRDHLSLAPVAVEVRDVHKTFRIPRNRRDSFKERVTHPFAKSDYRELNVLKGVSFDVHQGEFFGIVGRNGSGKSSLLKIMASIYRADQGTVRLRGRVAPFIELGVGFNQELTARENVVLNGVMMGVGLAESRARMDAVLEFAELEEFVDLKLKNYSSGMLVRLAFAVMVEADADVMLIDEVLAVGDAAFAQKCMDVFQEKRQAGKTIVLVTHDMATVQGLCDRAMLIHDGDLKYLGDPEEAAMEYYRLNFGGHDEGGDDAAGQGIPDIHVRTVHARLRDPAGHIVDNIEQGDPLLVDLLFEARKTLVAPAFSMQVLNADGVVVLSVDVPIEQEGERSTVPVGGRMRIEGSIDNPLMPGRYFLHCFVLRERGQGVALQLLKVRDFMVFGTNPGAGAVSVQAELRGVPEAGT